MDLNNIFFVYKHHPGDKHHYQLVAKFALDGTHFEVLEDHLGFGWDKKPPKAAARAIERLKSSMYYLVVSGADLASGHYPELLREHGDTDKVDAELVGGTTSSPPSQEFEYEPFGGEGVRTLSVSDGQVFLDGHLLSPEEHEYIKGEVKAGSALLRRKLQKSIFNEGFGPSVMDRHLQEDSLHPALGNLRSYRADTRPGVHAHIDVSDVRHVNKTYGHSVGESVLRAHAKHLIDTARTVIGPEAKVYRLGGDKFAVHLPSPDAAGLFARSYRTRMESIPPLKGTHRLTAAIGVGPTPDHAAFALSQSKGRRDMQGHRPGQGQFHFSFVGE